MPLWIFRRLTEVASSAGGDYELYSGRVPLALPDLDIPPPGVPLRCPRHSGAVGPTREVTTGGGGRS